VTDVHGNIGAYVAGALTGAEAEEFEQHLAGCESCAREVAEFRQTTAELTALAATPPPPALRQSVLAAIREIRPLPPEEPDEKPDPLMVAPLDDHPSEMPWDLDSPPAPPVSEPEPPPRRASRVLAVALAAALLVAMALGGWVYQLSSQQHAQVVAAQNEAELLSAPDAAVYTSTINGAEVSYVVSKQRNQALFLGTGLPDPGPDMAYQLWTLGREPTADLAVEHGGTVRQWFRGPIAGATGLAVTVEPAGSRPRSPTGPVLARVEL
jgi:anti-sigma factor RsiW